MTDDADRIRRVLLRSGIQASVEKRWERLLRALMEGAVMGAGFVAVLFIGGLLAYFFMDTFQYLVGR